MAHNRQTRRSQKRQQQPATPTLEQLAAAMPPPPAPLIIHLDQCRAHIRPTPNGDGAKELLFIHITGSPIFRAILPPPMQQELAAMLTTPGIVIPPNGDAA